MSDEPQKHRDRRWVRQIQMGDRDAFEELFHAYVEQLYVYAEEHVDSPTIAEDIVQNVFCDLWERHSEWDPQGTVKAYLYRAVRNTALDRLDRRQVREDWEEEEEQRDQHTPQIEPMVALQKSELRKAIQGAVEDLPDQQRLVYRLAHHHGLSYREIASALGIARKTVANHMSRALRSLRNHLAKHVSSQVD